MAFGFGLIHGFGFSFALRESLQFAGSHLLTSLLAFNVGVELGQLLVLIVLVPVLNSAVGGIARKATSISPERRAQRLRPAGSSMGLAREARDRLLSWL